MSFMQTRCPNVECNSAHLTRVRIVNRVLYVNV